jgi:hypothetical protein
MITKRSKTKNKIENTDFNTFMAVQNLMPAFDFEGPLKYVRNPLTFFIRAFLVTEK